MSRRLRPRTRNWLLILVTLSLIVLAHRLTPRRELVSIYFDAPRPMVIAHQGGDGLRPSNTLLAFQHAVDLGVHVLEMDVHRTADGALVLMHDATVDRTTDGSGPLAEMTLEAVKRLDAAYHWPYRGEAPPYRGRGVRVPTLAEVVNRFPEMRYNVEIKSDSAAAGRAVCEELGRLEATERVLVASFHDTAMDAFRGACPSVPTSAQESDIRWFYLLYRIGVAGWAKPTAAAFQVPTHSGGYDLSERTFLDAARENGLHVDYWTINDPNVMRQLIERGADGIITDRPDLLIEVASGR